MRVLALLLLAGLAREPAGQLPPGVSCELVRAEVTKHGRAASIAWALRQGYPWRQIRAALACLDR